jgi:hypothetical protein
MRVGWVGENWGFIEVILARSPRSRCVQRRVPPRLRLTRKSDYSERVRELYSQAADAQEIIIRVLR